MCSFVRSFVYSIFNICYSTIIFVSILIYIRRFFPSPFFLINILSSISSRNRFSRRFGRNKKIIEWDLKITQFPVCVCVYLWERALEISDFCIINYIKEAVAIINNICFNAKIEGKKSHLTDRCLMARINCGKLFFGILFRRIYNLKSFIFAALQWHHFYRLYFSSSLELRECS